MMETPKISEFLRGHKGAITVLALALVAWYLLSNSSANTPMPFSLPAFPGTKRAIKFGKNKHKKTHHT